MNAPEVRWLGRIAYTPALAMQEEAVAARGAGECGDRIFPGQLVGYFIFDLQKLKPDLHVFLRWIEEGLIALLADYGLAAQRREGLTGVWIEDRKIASIGVGVRKWITMHGFGLNVGSDLSGFEAITPCGIQGVTMTSISRELGREVSVEETAKHAAQVFRAHYASLSTVIPNLSTPQ